MDIRYKLRIGVIGGSRADRKFLDLAYKVGKLIAAYGGILVCGGLDGVMEAAARGAKEAGGLTVGIIPGSNKDEANAHIDLAVATGLGHTRNSLVAMNSDVLIAIDGEYGTLSEIAFARIYGKRVIGLETWDIPNVFAARTPEEAVALAFQDKVEK